MRRQVMECFLLSPLLITFQPKEGPKVTKGLLLSTTKDHLLRKKVNCLGPYLKTPKIKDIIKTVAVPIGRTFDVVRLGASNVSIHSAWPGAGCWSMPAELHLLKPGKHWGHGQGNMDLLEPRSIHSFSIAQCTTLPKFTSTQWEITDIMTKKYHILSDFKHLYCLLWCSGEQSNT